MKDGTGGERRRRRRSLTWGKKRKQIIGCRTRREVSENVIVTSVNIHILSLITSMILLPSVSTWLENITALGSEALVENDDVQIDRFCVFSSFVLAGLIVLFSWGGAV